MSIKRSWRQARRRTAAERAARKRRPWVITGCSLAALSLIGLIVLAACSADSRRAEARTSQLADQVDDLARETVYFRDRAGICWGIVWVGSFHGGPAGGPVPSALPGGPCPPAPPPEAP